ncbi:MAG: ImmA/IrrE family metallo-endopeptidase [Propionibacteriaceae bacterium]|nr:ImmA/IrrE family metallo-endopeptidase [Propionibacteriaceae bacterium]
MSVTSVKAAGVIVDDLGADKIAPILVDPRRTDQLTINERLQIVDYARIEATRLCIDGTIENPGEFPVDVYAATQRMGIPVEQATIPPDPSSGVKPAGLIYKAEGEALPHILVQKDIDPRHQLFTAAHELGHYLFWRVANPAPDAIDVAWGNIRPEHDDDDTLDHEDIQPSEYAANTFAHLVLMPDTAVVAVLQAGKTVAEMAAFFGVTVKSATRRLSYFDVGSQTY